ncbi:MAG: hypothetical protein ACLFPQ_06900 [Candidatus Woesearchaeota archaeon]
MTLSKKVLRMIIFYSFLVLVLALVIFLNQCKLRSYYYSYQTRQSEKEIYNIGCYDENITKEEYNSLECNSMIEEHNEIIDEWYKLPCVDESLMVWD